MQIPAPAAWAWIPIVLGAALSQTARNAAQRTISTTLGAWPATLVRFLYGLPFAVLWLAVVYALDPAARGVPPFGWKYAGWIVGGALAQILATWLLLTAMAQRNFIIGVTFSKTEVLQVALFAILFLHEVPTGSSGAAVVLGTAGVLLVSLPARAAIADAAAWLSPATLYGLASGACFALANVGYRGAALELQGASPWLVGAWDVVWAQALQSVALAAWLERRQPGSLRAIAGAWRVSLLAGACGALASIGWLTAVALRPAADVRILGLTEVFFSYLVSRRLFREHMRWSELSGMCLIIGGVVLVCL